MRNLGSAPTVTITRGEEAFLLEQMRRHADRVRSRLMSMEESLNLMRFEVEQRLGERGIVINSRATRWKVI